MHHNDTFSLCAGETKARTLSEIRPWTETEATDEIRKIAVSEDFDLWISKHASERMAERNLIMGDILYVLKSGFVRSPSIPSTQQGYFKYLVESRTPNSDVREVGVVVVPDRARCSMKVVTVMWRDEKANKAGSIVGENA